MQKTILFFLVAAAVLAGCSDNQYKKSRSGLLYKIYSDGKGPVAQRNQVIKLHFRQKLKDSVLQETYTSVPGYALVDSVGPVYNAAELFPLLRKGDSLVVVLLGDSINKKFGLPPFMKKEDKIMLHFKVLDIFPTTEAATADRTAEFNKQKDRQAKAFADYMAKKPGLQKTPGGVFVDVKSAGDGPQVENGKLISVKYTGKLIPSEKQFESNMDGSNPPIEYVISPDAQMIKGWNEGLLFFKKGGKGTLYIPYELAYGEQQGPGGLPFQPLMFDIEIVDVKDAPKGGPGQQPFMPERMPNSADTSHRDH
jgi:FKBP-type peptidyl-prolyl cis-trans isomerase FkpA